MAKSMNFQLMSTIAFSAALLSSVAARANSVQCFQLMRDGSRVAVAPPTSNQDLKGTKNPLLRAELGGIPESTAFVRAGIALEGKFEPELITIDGKTARYKPGTKGVELEGTRYVEFPNSTSLTTTNPGTGETREFILTRGVKPYEARMNIATGVINPANYVSDVLLFERVNGTYVFRKRVLASAESKGFFFEDPRISVVFENGRPHYFLSGTDYSSHVTGSKDPDVMNRFVELKIDANGLPRKVDVDSRTGKPEFMDLSPAPRLVDGKMLFVDAKNATIAQNDLGQIVVRTRLRPDFKHSFIKRLANGDRWDYAEQVFAFENWAHFRSYDWNDALVDLFGRRGEVATSSTRAPLVAKTIIRDSDLKEHLVSNDPKLRIASEKPKGLGPGTRPVRLVREGNELFASEGFGAELVSLGKIPNELLTKFPVEDGRAVYATFDHEIRYLYQTVGDAKLRRRHYSASIKIFDATLTNMIGYLPDVIQTVTPAERGLNSGILDLQHVYPMGWVLARDANGKQIVRVYAGASDAHTTIYDFNMIRLLAEKR